MADGVIAEEDARVRRAQGQADATLRCYPPHTLAEAKIADAIATVLELPADPRLTRAVTLLLDAKMVVADYVDGVPWTEPEIPIRGAWVPPHSETNALSRTLGGMKLGEPPHSETAAADAIRRAARKELLRQIIGPLWSKRPRFDQLQLGRLEIDLLAMILHDEGYIDDVTLVDPLE